MTTPSNADLRDKLINLVHDIAEQDYVGVTPDQASVFADKITALFQAREQQLLDSLYEPRDDCSVAETVLVNLQEALEERKKA